jgi:hypothetical protein
MAVTLLHVVFGSTAAAFFVSKATDYSFLAVLPILYLTTLPLYVVVYLSYIYPFYISELRHVPVSHQLPTTLSSLLTSSSRLFPAFHCGVSSSKSSLPNVVFRNEDGTQSWVERSDTSFLLEQNVLLSQMTKLSTK